MKPHVLCFTLVCACVLLFTLTGCKRNPASLVGIYSIEENGSLTETVRIVQRGDAYFISEKDGPYWLIPTEVTSVDNREVGKILGTHVTGISEGLGNNLVAVLQVPKGWRLGEFECKTGFWLASSLGPLELHKD
jgi:hypothetical protein